MEPQYPKIRARAVRIRGCTARPAPLHFDPAWRACRQVWSAKGRILWAWGHDYSCVLPRFGKGAGNQHI